jgi:hypothetical protein
MFNLRKVVIIAMIVMVLVPSVGLVNAQYGGEKPAGFVVTLAPKPAGQSQGFVTDPDKIYPMNPDQSYLPIAGHVTPGSMETITIGLAGTNYSYEVDILLFGLFLTNFPIEGIPPGVYSLTFNGYHAATIQIVS